MSKTTPVNGDYCSQQLNLHRTSSEGKTYLFAILIILGIGSLGLGAVGLARVIKTAALTNQAITMMAAGGGGGILFLLIGMISLLKNSATVNKSSSLSDHAVQKDQGYIIHPQDNISRPASCFQPMTTPERKVELQTQFIVNTRLGNICDKLRFGKEEWKLYYGIDCEEPPLPEDMEEILDNPCPFAGDLQVKVRHTHMLVLIPPEVTLNSFEELIKNPTQKSGGYTGQFTYSHHLPHQLKNIKPETAYWVLMTRDLIPDSERRFYWQQKYMIEAGGETYSWPRALEVAVCIGVESVISPNRLFKTGNVRCIERDENSHDKHFVCVGSTENGSPRFSLQYGDMDASSIGITALRRF